MSFGVSVQSRGTKELLQALRNMDPEKNPRAVREALKRSGRVLRKRIREELQGPRPRKLDEVTGELRSSVASDASRVGRFEVRAGVPADLFWSEFHELGLGRFRKRAFVLPATDRALEEFPAIFVEEWERSVD